MVSENMDTKEVSDRLAARLKEARKTQGLSLDSLSKLSGVSNSMISQIERAETNPTVVTILRLTNALKVDFSGLIEDEISNQNPIKQLMRADQVPVIGGHGSGCTIRVLSTPEDLGSTEIYDISFEKGGELASEPHSKGCIETLTVFSGDVTVTSGNASETLSSGDTIRYAADNIHLIQAQKKRAHCLLIVSGA